MLPTRLERTLRGSLRSRLGVTAQIGKPINIALPNPCQCRRMHAPVEPLAEGAVPQKAPRERLISIPYLLLRGSTAAGAFAMGFVQTFVFARILDPERFSIFIITGAVGYSLWITDLGLAKIAFVNLRAPHLQGRRDERAAREATAVILFYVALALAAAVLCFPAELLRAGASMHGAFDLALFMAFIVLNLAWFSLRTLSIAVDLFVYFERLELVRRAANIASLLAMLAGLPLTAFLVGSNLLWAGLFATATAKLVARGALVLHLRGFPRELLGFFRSNRPAIARSATGALSGLFVATFPYYVVPFAYGLGAAPIILEVTFKIFRGACVIFAAVCDLAIPGQTRAFAARDAKRLVKTTLLAVALCLLPALLAARSAGRRQSATASSVVLTRRFASRAAKARVWPGMARSQTAAKITQAPRKILKVTSRMIGAAPSP